MPHDDKLPIAIPLEELKTMAAAVASDLRGGAASSEPVTSTGGGSRHRRIPEPLRQRFIDVRAALFQRGIYDPVLVRFDTATVTQATTAEVADQLDRVVETLQASMSS